MKLSSVAEERMRSLSKVVKSDNVLLQDELKDVFLLPPHNEKIPKSLNLTLSKNAVESADTIVKGALIQAEDITEKAKEEAREMYIQARQRGFDEGLDAGGRKAAVQAEARVLELEKENLEKFQAAVRKIEQQYEEKIREQYLKNLETAFALAEKILDIQINRNDEAFLGLYKKAAAHIGKTESVQLKVGHRGYEVSSRNREELMKCISGLKNLELEESGEEGTCVIQSPMGEADASIKTQLNRAREIIQAS